MSVRSEWRARQRKIAEAKGMTLEQLRAAQPRRDQSKALFQRAPLAEQRAYSPWPRTLEELRDRCADFGIAATTECQWTCVERWLWDATDPALSNSLDDTRSAVSLVRSYDRALLGFPNCGDKPWPDPVFFRLNDAEQDRAKALADEAFRAWDRADRPHLTPQRMKLIFQVITSSPAWADRYPTNTITQETE